MTKLQFSPPWWARNPHIQTILPLFTKVKKPHLKRQRLELDDGDFIDLDWSGIPVEGEPIVVLVHGLEGSANSHYARRLLQILAAQNICALVHHHRSCSGVTNRLARSYHSGDTQDLQSSLLMLQAQFPNCPIYAVGYSLGGNVLAKYLGEQQHASLIKSAVVVSAPLQLAACATRLKNGFSKVYQSYLIKQLQQKVYDKLNIPDLSPQMPLTQADVAKLTTFHLFDDRVTAPLHGFTGVDDYYARSSGLPYLSQITTPTLVIHAKDDPFMNDEVIPSQNQLAPAVVYELHNHGGHVGFIDGGTPLKPQFYLEKRIVHFLFEQGQ
ncbi:hydrolase [Shewanella sp. Isolate11]|uniref:hydrolase n=1 Tax=Shewanella sp. Isolate11 TaxID=2908530 RepID=UPI001EFE2436|nr:hydrolase [Shewanella sp. Isolate11]MCG9697529.1 hydrolase [Shewanella sp. Isolate11]